VIAVRMEVSIDTEPRFVLAERWCDGETLGHVIETRVCRDARYFVGGRGVNFEKVQHILAAAGRTSVDRSSKATLLLTGPGGALKSSAMDVSVRPFGIAIAMLFIKLYVVG
jgi:hypothetical protein